MVQIGVRMSMQGVVRHGTQHDPTSIVLLVPHADAPRWLITPNLSTIEVVNHCFGRHSMIKSMGLLLLLCQVVDIEIAARLSK